jgi:hypothetical protein
MNRLKNGWKMEFWSKLKEHNMAKVFRDEIAMVCHEMMEDLYKDGIVNDAEMREFEKNCFVQTPELAAKNQIKHGKSPPLAAAML